LHPSAPQTIAALLGAANLETTDPSAPNHHDPGLGALNVLNLHPGANGLELFGGIAGAVHFAALCQRDHAKACALSFTFANHLEVTQLKQLQGQQSPGE
jgi:hypothetical protein